MTDLDRTHPAISDLRKAARRRVPHFVFEYLDSGTGTERGVVRNRAGLDETLFQPAILKGLIEPDLKTTLLGRNYDHPFGIAPVGLAGLVWAHAEIMLATAARAHNLPYCQSTVAAATPEDVADHIGDVGWFQHYPANTAEVRRDMLRRAREAGFHTLIMTVDVPGESRRERQRRAHVAMPPRMTPEIILSMLMRPAWSLAMARAGAPRMKFPESYVDAEGKDAFVHAGRVIRGWPDWDYLRAVREDWPGHLVIKGVQDPSDAVRLAEEGVDAIWVSNHTGRQFEGGPAAISCLPAVRAAVGPEMPLIYDSGIEGGLDIMRALALGADFVFLGKAFYFALAALGPEGIDHLVHILDADLAANMAQIGAVSLDNLGDHLLTAKEPEAGHGKS